MSDGLWGRPLEAAMPYVITTPETLTAAAAHLAAIDSSLREAHQSAVAPTVGLVPAAADEVSASIAHLFSQYGGGFQALAGKATAFHEQFVHNLKASAASYTSVEDTIAWLLRGLNDEVRIFENMVERRLMDIERTLNWISSPEARYQFLEVFGPFLLFFFIPLLVFAIAPFVAVFEIAQRLITWIIAQIGLLL
jgi:hypothetical protein